MRTKIKVIVDKEWQGKQIQHPEEMEIETQDVGVLSKNLKSAGIAGITMRLTKQSFKDLIKVLTKTGEINKMLVL